MAEPSQHPPPPDLDPDDAGPAMGLYLINWVRVEWKLVLKALVIICAGWWIYSPVLHGHWVMDDSLYVTNNELLRDSAGLWKIWNEPGSFIEYYPIDGTVLWLQWHLWQKDTFGYHVTNVVLHIINALLVWRLLDKFGLRLAWLGGLIFVLHPTMVESVGWISELKNTLCLGPFLLAMCAWIDYAREERRRDYALALVLFLLAMLCKITMAPFPIVILLYAWWKRGRITLSDLMASIPFFLVSLGMGILTVWVGIWYQHFQNEEVIPLGGFFPRVACAGLSLSFYLWKAIWPLELSPIYPQWKINPPSLIQFLPWLLFAGILAWLWSNRAGWGRHVLLGLGFFTLNLLPFLGFNAISYMHSTWVMDHFLYIPILGLIGLVVAGVGQIQPRFGSLLRPYDIGIVTMALVLLAWESHGYSKMFFNESALWNRAVQVAPDSWVAHNNLGVIRMEQSRLPEAIKQFQLALELNPNKAEILTNLGAALLRSDQISEAIDRFNQALVLAPDYPEAHTDLGNALEKENRYSEAIEQYKIALRLNPGLSEAQNNFGGVLMKKGQIEEAMTHYKEAVKINPDDSGAHSNLGSALMKAGRIPEAMEEFETALTLNPDMAEARAALGNALLKQNRLPEAIGEYQAALRIKPDFAEAHNNLGGALQKAGHLQEAAYEYREALRLNPEDVEAQKNLDRLLGQKKANP